MLTEQEKVTLSIVADNPGLCEALQKVILAQFNVGTIPISPLNTDEQLGQLVRAQITGVNKVENAFREIAQYKSDTSKTVTINPAR